MSNETTDLLQVLRNQAAEITRQRQAHQDAKDALASDLRAVNDRIAEVEQRVRDQEALAGLDGRDDAGEIAQRLGLA